MFSATTATNTTDNDDDTTQKLERVPEGNRGRPLLLRPQLHPAELLPGQREGLSRHPAQRFGTRRARRPAALLVHGHRLPLGHRAAGDHHDGGGAAVRADDRGGLRELHFVVHHFVRRLHRGAGHLERVSRNRGAHARVSAQGHGARVPQAEEPGPHVGHRLPFPQRDCRPRQA